MADQPSTVEGTGLAPAARLEPNAIGVAQDTVIGMASSAPAAGVAAAGQPPTGCSLNAETPLKISSLRMKARNRM